MFSAVTASGCPPNVRIPQHREHPHGAVRARRLHTDGQAHTLVHEDPLSTNAQYPGVFLWEKSWYQVDPRGPSLPETGQGMALCLSVWSFFCKWELSALGRKCPSFAHASAPSPALLPEPLSLSQGQSSAPALPP